MSYARPNLQPLGPNIAEQQSKYYNFQVKQFVSKDQKRTYRVWLGIPKNIKQGQSYPALYMLDGNSAMDRLNDQILKQVAEQKSMVLVAIGYKTNLPFESGSRSVDYTPSDESGNIHPDPRSPDRMGGGSNQFSALIEQQISPWVEQQVKLDPTRRAIWGHSYGGLFVLDTLLHSQYFSHYFAASPSLSWADNRMIKKIDTMQLKQASNKQLLLMEGDIAYKPDAVKSPNYSAAGFDNLRYILSKFDQSQVKSRLLIYPNLSHGEVFGAALSDVLLNINF